MELFQLNHVIPAVLERKFRSHNHQHSVIVGLYNHNNKTDTLHGSYCKHHGNVSSTITIHPNATVIMLCAYICSFTLLDR